MWDLRDDKGFLFDFVSFKTTEFISGAVQIIRHEYTTYIYIYIKQPYSNIKVLGVKNTGWSLNIQTIKGWIYWRNMDGGKVMFSSTTPAGSQLEFGKRLAYQIWDLEIKMD